MTSFHGLDVSRETIQNLEAYADLVLKWTKTINLISKPDWSSVWTRHIADSAQLLQFIEKNPKIWADLGAGGGFPGVVCSIMAREVMPDCMFHFVESDHRKCAFLRTATREFNLNAFIHAERIESTQPIKADVVSARALAPLTKLMEFSERHIQQDGISIFPKGKNWLEEERQAQKSWSYTFEAHKSQTNDAAVILTIKDIKRV